MTNEKQDDGKTEKGKRMLPPRGTTILPNGDRMIFDGDLMILDKDGDLVSWMSSDLLEMLWGEEEEVERAEE